ncbi:hypothetical protein ACTS94_16160 [Empedobacter falsenii]
MNKFLTFFKSNSWWITLIISLGALFISLFRTEPMEADWMAILVGILALLTSVLIGWQILNMINFKQEKLEVFKSVENVFINNYKKEFDNKILEFNKERVLLNYNMFKLSSKRKDSFYEEFTYAIEILRTYNEKIFEQYFYDHTAFVLLKDLESRSLVFEEEKDKSNIIESFQVILMSIKEPAIKIRLKKIEQYLSNAKVLNV